MSGNGTAQDSVPLRPDDVYQALTAALALDAAARASAQKRLQDWEADSAPGFIGSLLSIVQGGVEVAEEARLMATVVAKNAVGSSWRKTMGSREWSRVPEEEKAYVRTTALACLISDPSPRVAVQLALLISNLARFDVPRPWNTLLPELVSMAALDNPLPPGGKLRALKALKHTIRALKGKRFAIEAPQGLVSLSDVSLTQLTAQIDRDRKSLADQLRALLSPLHTGWSSTLPTLLAGGELGQACGLHAAACLAAEAESLSAIVELGPVTQAFHSLMNDGAAAAGQLAPLLSEAASGTARGILICKCWERLLGCALAGLDRHAMVFAEHVSDWAGLCASTALLGLDASTVHHIRTKSRVLLTRFTARVLIQPLYRADVVELHATGALGYAQREGDYLPGLEAARDALDSLLTPERCGALVEAVVTKYIALSPEEVEEWEGDAESFARQVDVETSPDADTPRPCGVALLECMLERRREPVAAALVEAARQLQAVQPKTHETILLTEATYRAIGECLAHVRSQVDFAGWYAAELRQVLLDDFAGLAGQVMSSSSTTTDGRTTTLDASILRARALWLVGVCGEELPSDAWEEAFALCVRHARAADLVVALMAVSASTALVAQVLEESAFLQRAPERRRGRGLLDPGVDTSFSFINDDDEEMGATLEAAEAEYELHLAAVTAQVDGLAGACFALLARVEESESMVRVLHAVSAAVELLGGRLSPHLGAITDALPGVWETVAARRGGEGPGAAARLHAALIGVLAHLVGRLGLAAVREPRVAALLAPLLLHATDVANPDAEPLLDDGLRLWRAVLQHSNEIGPLLRDMLGARLAPLVARGQDLVALYGIAEGYALLGGAGELSAVLPGLAERADASIGKVLRGNNTNNTSSITQDVRTPTTRQQPPQSLAGGLRAARKATLAADDIQEALAAAGLVHVLLQELPRGEPMPPSLQTPLRAAAELAGADFGGSVMRLPARAVGVLEAALQIVCAALWNDPATWRLLESVAGESHATRLLDRWISMSLTVDMAELFIAALATAARSKRHESAVTLAALLCADAAQPLRDVTRSARVIVLGLKCVRESPAYRRDLENLQETIQASGQQDADQLVLRRLQLAASRSIAHVDVAETVRATAQRIAGWHGESALLDVLRALDPSFPDQLRAVLQGGEEKDMLAALEAMHLQRNPEDEAVTVLPTAR